MKLTTFSYKNPDSDGEIRLDAELIIENKSDFDVEYVKGSVIIVNENNVTVGGGNIEDDRVFIAAKESGSIEGFPGWLRLYKQQFKTGTGADIKAYISATTFRREFIKIGTLDFPAKIGDLTEIKKAISLGGFAECLGVSCLREKDEDGYSSLNIQTGFRNTSDSYIARAQLSVKAMDQRDAQIDEDFNYAEIPPKSGHVFEPSFYGLKPGKMKNGTFSITASIFVPIESFSLEVEPEFSDE